MRTAIEEYYHADSLDGCWEEFDYGNDGYVDFVAIRPLEDADRAMWPEDFDAQDAYVSVHTNNQGFITVGGITQADYEANEADYAEHCAQLADVD